MIRIKAFSLIVCSICFLNGGFAQPWFQKSSFGGEARHRATAFSIGNFGYIGLGHINSAVDVEYEDFWKYDPASDSWTQISDYPEGKCFHVTGFVIDDKAYAGTGRKIDGTYFKRFYEYDPTTNVWTSIADFPGSARRGAVSFAINGSGFVGTGQTTGGYSNDFYRYVPASNSWFPIPNLPGAVRTSSVAFELNGMGYVGTGNTNAGSTNDFWMYNPVTNSWTPRASVGPTTRQEATGFSLNGKGYIGTGDDYSSGNNFSDFWEFNPSANTWVQIEDFSGTARRYLVSFVIGDRAYCGTGTNGTNFRDFWMFDRYLSVVSEGFKKANIFVYPNPFSETISVDFKSVSLETKNKIKIEVIDMTGRLYDVTYRGEEKLILDLMTKKSGIYLLNFKVDGEVLLQKKIIKS